MQRTRGGVGEHIKIISVCSKATRQGREELPEVLRFRAEIFFDILPLIEKSPYVENCQN